MTPLYQLELLMSKNNITKYRLAKEIGTSSQYVYDVFSGRKKASFSVIKQWAEALGYEVTTTIKEKE